MLATLTSKGQLTLPKAVRTKMDLQPGDKLDFVLLDNGTLEVVPLKQPPQKLRGILPRPTRPVSIEEMNTAIERGSSSHDGH